MRQRANERHGGQSIARSSLTASGKRRPSSAPELAPLAVDRQPTRTNPSFFSPPFSLSGGGTVLKVPLRLPSASPPLRWDPPTRWHFPCCLVMLFAGPVASTWAAGLLGVVSADAGAAGAAGAAASGVQQKPSTGTPMLPLWASPSISVAGRE